MSTSGNLTHPSSDRQLFERYIKRPSGTGKEPLISYFCPFCKRPFARQANTHETCPSCHSPLAPDSNADAMQNLRAIERIRKSGQIRLYTDSLAQPVMADIVDLSPQGMRFQCREKLVPKTTVKISGRNLRAVAVVRNIHKMIARGGTCYSVGVEFITVQFSQPKAGFYSTSA